jgi:NodT family efflux transporter outer membrane factor (OMF) lipoprotein
MLLVPAGCHIPQLCLPECGPPLPSDFNGVTSPQNSAQLSVEEFFNDRVLIATIAQALASNQELKIMNQEIQLASYEVLARRGAYLPFASFRADAGLDKHSLYTPEGAAEEQLLTPEGEHFPDPLPNFLLGFDFLWRVDIWREFRNLRAAAVQRYYAAIERRNYFATTLVADIADNYYELLALDNRLQILDRIIGLQQQSLNLADANKQAGRGTELAVQRFQAEMRKNQSEVLIVKQEIIETENRINLLVGRFPQPVERASVDFMNLTLHALDVGVPSQLLLYRRDIQQAEHEIAASGLDVRAARARFFPRLDITGTVGYEAFNPRFLFKPDALVVNLTGGLVAPLINRTAIRAEYQSANARQLQAVYNYQRVVLNAFTEVVNSMSRMQNYRQSVGFKQGQMTSLEAAVEAANRLYQSARAEYVEVLLAQRDLLDSRTVLIQTKQQELQAIVDAYRALGGGTWLYGSPPNPNGAELQPIPPEPIDAPPTPAGPPPAGPVPGAPLPAGPMPGAPLPASPLPAAPLLNETNRRITPPASELVVHASYDGWNTNPPVLNLAHTEPNAAQLPVPLIADTPQPSLAWPDTPVTSSQTVNQNVIPPPAMADPAALYAH